MIPSVMRFIAEQCSAIERDGKVKVPEIKGRFTAFQGITRVIVGGFGLQASPAYPAEPFVIVRGFGVSCSSPTGRI